jgi:hypothetical protein
MVYLLKDLDPVGLSLSRLAELPKWTVVIGRTGFDTIPSIPDPTLSLTQAPSRDNCQWFHGHNKCQLSRRRNDCSALGRGFDCAGTCADEVADPGRTYPRALMLAVVMVRRCRLTLCIPR